MTSNINIYYSLQPLYILSKILGSYLVPREKHEKFRWSRLFCDILWCIPFHAIHIYLTYLSLSSRNNIEMKNNVLIFVDTASIVLYMSLRTLLMGIFLFRSKNIKNIVDSLVELNIGDDQIYVEERKKTYFRFVALIITYSYNLVFEHWIHFAINYMAGYIFMGPFKFMNVHSGLSLFCIVSYFCLFNKMFTKFNEYIKDQFFNKPFDPRIVVHIFKLHFKIILIIKKLHNYVNFLILLEVSVLFGTIINTCNITSNVITTYKHLLLLVVPCLHWFLITAFWLIILTYSASTLQHKVTYIVFKNYPFIFDEEICIFADKRNQPLFT